MLERDDEYFSKYGIDSDIDDYFDSFEIPDFVFKTDPEPDLNDIDLDEMDEYF